MFLGLFLAPLSQRPILLVPEPMAGCRGVPVLLERSCVLTGQRMLMGGWWEQGGVVLTEPWKDSNVMMQCPPQGWGSHGGEEGHPEDGCPSSTGSAAALADVLPSKP